VYSGFGNSINWTLPVLTTIIHFTNLQYLNQSPVFWVRYSVTVLPSRRIFTSVFSAPCRTRGSGTLLSLSVSMCKLSRSLSLMLRPTVSRPVRHGIEHPSGAYDKIFITVRQLRVCWSGAFSLTRGRVRLLQLLLALASAVILASESHCLRFETSLFVASYDSQGYGGGIRPRLHTGLSVSSVSHPLKTALSNWIGNT
jgi:hypothetical protein